MDSDNLNQNEMSCNGDYLAHHGILGMHWGVRRYQNYDGSLTSLGRKRRGYKSTRSTDKKTVNSSSSDGMAKVKKAIRKAKKVHQKKQEERKLEKQKAEIKAKRENTKKQTQQRLSNEEQLKQHIRSHPRDLYKYRNALSEDDIKELIGKIEFDRKCKDISRDEYRRGIQKVNDIKDGLTAAANLMSAGTTAYNNAALIYNAFAGESENNSYPLKQVKWKDDKKDDNKSK